MIDSRKISICIPSWERSEMTIESFLDVYNDERISEIIIVDDASGWDVYEDLKSMTDAFPKVRLCRNLNNLDCYFNKKTAISLADTNSEMAILLDSDNKISVDYLNKLYEIKEWDKNTIYTPSFAFPNFDFRNYEGLLITKENVAQWIDKPLFETMLNAANYFVNPAMYLEVWDGTTNPVTSDSIYQCYNWLKEGKKIQVVAGLTYEHTIHDGSHYKNNVSKTPQGFHESLLEKIRQLK